MYLVMSSFKLVLLLYCNNELELEIDSESIESTLPSVVRAGAIGQLNTIHPLIHAKIDACFTGGNLPFAMDLRIYKDKGSTPSFRRYPKCEDPYSIEAVKAGALAQLAQIHQEIRAYIIKTWV